MSIGISEEHVELAGSLREWAASLGGRRGGSRRRRRRRRDVPDAWKSCVEMGVATIGLPEAAGGGGGTVLDVAVALEACAQELVPGPLLSTAVAASLLGETPFAATLGEGAAVAIALSPTAVGRPRRRHPRADPRRGRRGSDRLRSPRPSPRSAST